MAIADLSKEIPTPDQLGNWQRLLLAETDRGAAIMAASLVELALRDAIRSRMVDPGGGVAQSWFDGINAPFGTFSAKIVLGRALGVYGENLEGRLLLIKNIRNAFAHRAPPLDFEHPTLVQECKKLNPHAEKHGDIPARVTFGAYCEAAAYTLSQFAAKEGGKAIEIGIN